MLKPKFFSIIKNRKKELSVHQLKDDIVAGIIVAIIALPLSVALAIASGVTPEKGLITAIIGGLLVSLLGGSRVQIGGPTGAFVVIIYGIIAQYGLDGLLISTILAGIFMIVMGAVKLGSVIKYIPYPTTTGFTSGIAVVLLSTQIKDFFGLEIDQVPSEFIEKWKVYIHHFNTIDLATTLVGLASIFVIIIWPKINKKIPGSLIALILITICVKMFNIPVETIGSRFGDISSSIKFVDFSSINISLPIIEKLIRPAITIAFLASIESLLSAVVADGMIGKKHNSNMELIAQGVANISSALFGGIPVTGAIARTAANVKNGGRTPVAGIVHALTLLLIMLVFMPLAKLIPMATLSAILVIVAYNMSEWRSFKGIFNSTKSDVAVLLATFVLTVLFDLVVAIEVGMIMAMFLFVRRMSENKLIENVSHELGIYINEEEDGADILDASLKTHLDSKIAIYEVNGPLFYGVVNTFLDMLNEMKSTTGVMILRMKNVNSMDATALNAVKQLDKRCKSQNILILYSETNTQPMKVLERSGFVEKVGRDCFFNTTEEAIKVASQIVKTEHDSQV
ncbi:SulP family inorganic anion transporter [Lacticigenium naphthae]|uniref:SulP family inorganic anion transporter n=1 Tax=Lacticigenium naphthae TaxID=515351 RepID=UPI000406A58A|nr:SulP family inorganic anion transporter [Lacticigenium naphthae]